MNKNKIKQEFKKHPAIAESLASLAHESILAKKVASCNFTLNIVISVISTILGMTIVLIILAVILKIKGL